MSKKSKQSAPVAKSKPGIPINIVTVGTVEHGKSMFYTETLTVQRGALEPMTGVFGHASSPEASLNEFVAGWNSTLVTLRNSGKIEGDLEFSFVPCELPQGASLRNKASVADLAAMQVALAKEVQEKQAKEIADIGKDIIQSTLQVAEKYLKLAQKIRTEQIPDGIVRETLLKLGFAKTRVSEVLRVAKAAPEVWNELEARKVGFRGALDMARGKDGEQKEAVLELAAATGQTPDDVEAKLGVAPEQAAPEGTAATKEETVKDKIAARMNSISMHGKVVLQAAEVVHALGGDVAKMCEPWNLGGHYELVIRRRKLSKGEAAKLAAAAK